MKALGDYLHERGLKFGIYNCAGSQTCAGYPGGAGHEVQDATLYASWGVDYLKYDWCNTGDADPRQRYGAIRDALYKAKRPVVLSMCEWGKSRPWLWARDYAHLWRTTGDITDQWDGQPENVFLSSVKSILDRQVGLERYAGPDGWNDPDMLEVGNAGLTVEESRAHFSMWCMLAAPLMAGNDLRSMTEPIRSILTDADAIAIDQDVAGKQGYRERVIDGVEIWIKELAGEEWAVCLLNASDSAKEVTVDWDSLKGLPFSEKRARFQIYDVWSKRSRGATEQPLKQSIKSHEVALFRPTHHVAPTTSELTFECSNKSLQDAFTWAKFQALAYAHDGTDPVGPWYEAALPGRSAFCMRDVAHQVSGAAALGLNAANLNMLRRFAAAVAPERDWAGYWEIDVTGKPAPIDYENDQDFWYNLPANFDILDAVYRMWLWTGDDAYISDPEFRRFFRTTSKEYVAAWQLQPGQVLSRPRIVNRHLANGRFIDKRGIPGYDEGQGTFTLGVDLLAAEYRAFMDLACLAEQEGDAQLREAHLQVASEIGRLIEKYAWSAEDGHYFGLLSSNGAGQSSGDLFMLRFGATRDPVRIRQARDYLKSPAYLKSINIELESYLPKIFFTYGQTAAAYDRLLALSDPTRERREYPEVSFAVVDAFVTGVMGIDMQFPTTQQIPTIQTVSRLRQEDERATISGVHIQGGLIDVTHVGHQTTSFKNRTDKTLRWKASFSGKQSELLIDGDAAHAAISRNMKPQPVSSITIDVPPGCEKTVSVK